MLSQGLIFTPISASHFLENSLIRGGTFKNEIKSSDEQYPYLLRDDK